MPLDITKNYTVAKKKIGELVYVIVRGSDSSNNVVRFKKLVNDLTAQELIDYDVAK